MGLPKFHASPTLKIMFETNAVDGSSTSQEQQALGSQSNFADSPVAYGLEAKQENLIASSLSELQENGSFNQENGFAFQYFLEDGGTLTDSDGTVLIEGGSTTLSLIHI